MTEEKKTAAKAWGIIIGYIAGIYYIGTIIGKVAYKIYATIAIREKALDEKLEENIGADMEVDDEVLEEVQRENKNILWEKIGIFAMTIGAYFGVLAGWTKLFNWISAKLLGVSEE